MQRTRVGALVHESGKEGAYGALIIRSGQQPEEARAEFAYHHHLWKRNLEVLMTGPKWGIVST